MSEELRHAKERLNSVSESLALLNLTFEKRLESMADELRKEMIKMHEQLPECAEKFSDIRVSMAEVQGDVSHIKGRIDGGMAESLRSVKADMGELKLCISKLTPVIEHHAGIIKRIEDIGWKISMGLGAAVVAVVVWAIRQGMKV